MGVGADLLPKAYEDEFKILLDKVPPRDFDVIKKIIESELCTPINEVFKTFNEEALAAACKPESNSKASFNRVLGFKIGIRYRYSFWQP